MKGSIWWFAFGYFAAYAPYSALTKALSTGIYPDTNEPIPGPALLPIATITSLLVMLVFLSVMGWWKYATQVEIAGRSIPIPTRWTALSGACTSVILTTTTLAYTFEGVSIVFVMLLMRGGVLIIAPVVDALTGRKARWFSWIGLAFSMAALVAAFSERGGYAISIACAVDIALYLTAYLVRLRFMSRLAKSDEREVTLRYFVEEQLVAVPLSVVLLLLTAVVGPGFGELGTQIREGLVAMPSDLWLEVMAIGALSQATGIFGTLVFLDSSENTFSVPVNRCSSILAGVVASAILAIALDAPWPSAHQLGGAGLVMCAILALTLGPWWSKRRSA